MASLRDYEQSRTSQHPHLSHGVMCAYAPPRARAHIHLIFSLLPLQDMKTLKLVVMDDQDRDPDPALAFCISKLYALLEGRGGHFEMET